MKNNSNKKCTYELSDKELALSDKIKNRLEQENNFVDIEISQTPSIIIYSIKKLSLTQSIPIMQSFNFVVKDEVSYEVTIQNKKYFISKLNIELKDIEKLKKAKDNISTLITSILNKEFNIISNIFELVYLENFSFREVFLFISLAKYKEQLLSMANYRSTIAIFIRHSEISKLILEYFINKFQPNISRNLDTIENKILEKIRNVEAISEDKVLRLILEIIKNTQRTNYFLNQDIISLKIHTDQIDYSLIGIIPKIETFVFHPSFNGVHLRMDKVSRGGLRWSNRHNDYRDEIKALMIAQEAKNAVIVPKGAKGGFVINSLKPTKEEFVEYYKMFISSLLDLVDNIVDEKIVRNSQIVSYDEDDTYFVVAADKGTSTMSDTANSIAIEKGFWLGDAFASGGSVGYDHKALGITAKGAIKSTERFFIEKGIDIYKDSITIVGIGSMNGDVFGNGLIESDKFLLKVAISHKEIFIDPTPNAKISYDERVRLFNEKNSNWANYNKDLISKGGGVFYRSSKEITLTPEIKNLINSTKDKLNGEELARELLQLKVDMIYLGGIGTYFKASTENNVEIGDKENENIRLDANEIKASVICEGANLGMTLASRIEFALLGGKVNLDSIDNSAGVNTSDNEVNIKIFLNKFVSKGVMNEEQRNTSFKDLTDHVVQSVLDSSRLQAIALSLDEKRAKKDLEIFKKTIHVLDMNLLYFSRKNFHIPRDVDFDKILTKEGSIARPTLSLILLYSKILIENILKDSNMVNGSGFDRYIFRYFPQYFNDLYTNDIKQHPLRKEIISMIISNDIINHCGASFIADFNDIGVDKFLMKIKTYLLNNKLFNADNLREKLYNSDINIDSAYKILIDLEDNIVYSAYTMQTHLSQDEMTFDNIKGYREDIIQSLNQLDFNADINFNDCSEDCIYKSFEYIKLTTAIIEIKRNNNINFSDLTEVVFSIVKKLNLIPLMQHLQKLELKNELKITLQKQTLLLLKTIIIDLSQKVIDFKRDYESISQCVDNYFSHKPRYIINENIDSELSLTQAIIIVNGLLLSN